MPGECWAIRGHTGNAVIQLVAKIIITSVSLEHIPKTISPTGEIESAPREFSFWVRLFINLFNFFFRLRFIKILYQ